MTFSHFFPKQNKGVYKEFSIPWLGFFQKERKTERKKLRMKGKMEHVFFQIPTKYKISAFICSRNTLPYFRQRSPIQDSHILVWSRAAEICAKYQVVKTGKKSPYLPLKGSRSIIIISRMNPLLYRCIHLLCAVPIHSLTWRHTA